MKILFILGKGGVGKSTLSALAGIHFAEKGKKVMLTSLDPAHNLADIFEIKLSDSPGIITGNLKAKEIDQEQWIKKYLAQSEKQIKKSYNYLTAFSMEKNFSVLQHAPALEEYAMLMAFKNTIRTEDNTEIFIFDMPPTALSIKFFALAQISLIWLKNLSDLRTDILKKQKIITVLSRGAKKMEKDRVQQNITEQINDWRQLDILFRDARVTLPIIVENPDTLSAKEARRIEDKLSALHIARPVYALNRAKEPSAIHKIFIPESAAVNGLVNLRSHCDNIDFKPLDIMLSS